MSPRKSLEWLNAWAELADDDSRLCAEFTRAWDEGVQRAGGKLCCRPGCIPCCLGPFEITALDGLRLAHSLTCLAAEQPKRAALVVRRARNLLGTMAQVGGEGISAGNLPADQSERESLLGEFASQPCPALSRRTGRCLLYSGRPLSCRSYGLPLSWGGEILPPCVLNLEGVRPSRWPLFAIAPDLEDLEGWLLGRVHALVPGLGDTTVAGAILMVTRP